MEPAQQVYEAAAFDLASLLDAGEGAVVLMEAGETRLVAHTAVLAARSPVFSAMFRHDTAEASSCEVRVEDVEGPVLRQLLAYLYTSRAPHLQLPGLAAPLLAAADKYGVLDLKEECERQVRAQLSVETAAEAAVLAVRHSCPGLRQAAVAFIRERVFQVMATRGWADATLNQPKEILEVNRLLAELHEETKASSGTQVQPHGPTAAAAASPAAAHRTALPDEAAVSRYRGLSAKEKGRCLVEAAEEGTAGDVRALLAAGADVGARDEYWRTALHRAAFWGRADVAGCLLAGGAEVDARDWEQYTPLHLAAYMGRTAVVRLLLAASADLSARDKWGSTPLHYAAAQGRAEAAAALLEAGADRGLRDNRGRTPLDVAFNKQLTQLLTEG